MTEEEMARFALVLEECERIRAQMVDDEAEEEAAASVNGGDVEPSGTAPSGG
jgi:hypothetical protein